jgi:DNA-directed RNA polymerase sigma subunit (sigma70/sigma32)
VRPDTAGTWLELVTAPPSQVWTDRSREIRKLREQGETLANIGRQFGLSAERVRQILLHEDQGVPDSVGSESA